MQYHNKLFISYLTAAILQCSKVPRLIPMYLWTENICKAISYGDRLARIAEAVFKPVYFSKETKTAISNVLPMKWSHSGSVVPFIHIIQNANYWMRKSEETGKFINKRVKLCMPYDRENTAH